MKRIILLLSVAALLAAPACALAANWWDDIGPAAGVEVAEPTPEPTAGPTAGPRLNLGSLFGGLLPKDQPVTEEPLEPKTTDAPIEEPIEEPDEPGDYWDNMLFDTGVIDITAQPYGGSSQYGVIDNWTVAYGNCDDHFCLFGWNDEAREYHILAETVVSDFIPVGDAFAYYGEVSKGKFGWLMRDPDQPKAVSLSLGELGSIISADERYLYYFNYGKGSGTTYHRMDHNGKNKKQLGKLNGRAVAMTPDGEIVVFNSSKNRVELFTGGKSEVIYQPTDEIQNVISTGREIWVAHQDYFGLLKDGRLDFQFPGSMRTYAATTDQLIVVLDDGTIRFPVLILNDVYRAHAVVGYVGAQDGVTVEMTPGWYNRMVVWGPRESLEFHTPYVDTWLPYGYHDLDAALAAGYRYVQ